MTISQSFEVMLDCVLVCQLFTCQHDSRIVVWKKDVFRVHLKHQVILFQAAYFSIHSCLYLYLFREKEWHRIIWKQDSIREDMESLSAIPQLFRTSILRRPSDKTAKAIREEAVTRSEPKQILHPVVNISSNTSHQEAQSALLLSVIRATPNEVFYGIAKDLVTESLHKVVTVVRKFAADASASLTSNRSFSSSSGISSESSSHVTGKIPSDQTCIMCHRCLNSSQVNASFFDSPEYLIVKSTVKMFLKLYLTLILEVVMLSLKLLGWRKTIRHNSLDLFTIIKSRNLSHNQLLLSHDTPRGRSKKKPADGHSLR